MVSRSTLHHSMRGFTLVELMIVIVIMAILAALAGPSFTSFIQKQRVRSAAYDLAQSFQAARSNAILSRRSVDVRASYPTTNNNWNGTKTGTLFNTDVTTDDRVKIAKSSFYVFESGTGASSAGTADNRVTKVTTLNDNVKINSTPVLIRFTSASAVQTASTTTNAPSNTSADVTFVVTYQGSLDAGYTVKLNHFGGVQVKKN